MGTLKKQKVEGRKQKSRSSHFCLLLSAFCFSMVSPVGIEPTTNWLKASCSTTELRARSASHAAHLLRCARSRSSTYYFVRLLALASRASHLSRLRSLTRFGTRAARTIRARSPACQERINCAGDENILSNSARGGPGEPPADRRDSRSDRIAESRRQFSARNRAFA